MIVLTPGTMHTKFNSIVVVSNLQKYTKSLNRALVDVKVVYFVCTEIENIES